MLTPSRQFSRRLGRVALLFFIILTVGVVGYVLIEGWSLVDAFYMTIITLTTVGFMEVQPLSSGGRIFTVLVILTGVSALAYSLGSLTDYIVAGELQGTLRARALRRQMDKLNAHYIVCGFGRVGRQVVQELEANNVPVLIIERDVDHPRQGEASERLFLFGDASDDDVLRRAGVERAKGLVAATESDAENVFITLSARALNNDLIIVSRLLEEENERKMRKAGANHVISPHAIGGRRMAGMLLHPAVVDFLDVVMHSEDLELWLEDVRVASGSPLAGLSVGDAAVRRRTGATILAIKTIDSGMMTNFGTDYVLRAGDVLVALGTRQQLDLLEQLAGPADA